MDLYRYIKGLGDDCGLFSGSCGIGVAELWTVGWVFVNVSVFCLLHCLLCSLNLFTWYSPDGETQVHWLENESASEGIC